MQITLYKDVPILKMYLCGQAGGSAEICFPAMFDSLLRTIRKWVWIILFELILFQFYFALKDNFEKKMCEEFPQMFKGWDYKTGLCTTLH